MSTGSGLLERASLTPLHWRIWLVAALGLLLDGFDFFVIGVCLPLISQDFSPTAIETGMLASAAVVGSVIGALVGGPIADRIGRKLVFRLDLLLFVAAALASAFAWDMASLIAFRFILGIAIGADYPLSSSYASEVAPARFRNRFLVGVISFQAIGSLLGVGLGLVILTLHPVTDAWRWILATGAVLALGVVFARIGVPESPAWLASQGRRDEAASVMTRLLERPISPEEVDSPDRPADPPWSALFRGRMLRITLFASIPWFLMDIVVYGIGVFTPTIFAAAAVTDSDSVVAASITSLRQTGFTDIFLVLGFAAALLLIGRTGLFRLQWVGFVLMAVGLGMLALAASIPGGAGAVYWLAFGGFALANFFQNMGPNSTTFAMPAVVYPTEIRATGAGFGAAAGKAGAVVVTLCFPAAQDAWGLGATVGLMAIGSVVAAVVTVVARPRVAGLSAPSRDRQVV